MTGPLTTVGILLRFRFCFTVTTQIWAKSITSSMPLSSTALFMPDALPSATQQIHSGLRQILPCAGLHMPWLGWTTTVNTNAITVFICLLPWFKQTEPTHLPLKNICVKHQPFNSVKAAWNVGPTHLDSWQHTWCCAHTWRQDLVPCCVCPRCICAVVDSNRHIHRRR